MSSLSQNTIHHQQTIAFSLAATDDRITAQSGLILLGDFYDRLGLSQWINLDLPRPGSGRGYQPHAFVLPLMLMLTGGGRSLEDLRMVRRDLPLCKLLNLKIPSTDAVGDWLRRAPLDGLQSLNRRLIQAGLARSQTTQHTLDADATQVVAQKQSAKLTYKGEQGYMPMVGHLAEAKLVVHAEFRDGNVAPSDSNLAFIQACEAQLPDGHRIAHIRQDAAAYQAEVFNYCEETGKSFAIGGRLDKPTQEVIQAIPDHAWQKYADCEVAETVHTMGKTTKAFRLIVVRYPHQAELFEDHPRYHVIASNRTESAGEILMWYRQRGNISENGIKELKIGFGMENMPCGQFGANAVYFALGVLAHNAFVLFNEMLLDAGWQKHKVATVRWRLFQIAGKLVRHAGQWVLKVGRDMLDLFERIRSRAQQL